LVWCGWGPVWLNVALGQTIRTNILRPDTFWGSVSCFRERGAPPPTPLVSSELSALPDPLAGFDEGGGNKRGKGRGRMR